MAEGRLDTAISTLRANIDAFRQAAIEDDSEALEAARPLLEDAKEDVAEAWAVVEAARRCAVRHHLTRSARTARKKETT